MVMLNSTAARFEFLQARAAWRELPAPHPQYGSAFLLDAYQGCPVACRYCFGATEDSLGLADPADFRAGVRTNAAFLLSQELKRRTAPAPVAVGAMSEPYQPAEERFYLTRQCLELLTGAGYPVHVLTKSRGVLRDADVLAPASQNGLAAVTVSLMSLKPSLVEWLEPFAPPPAARLGLIKSLADRGVIAGAALAPLLPRLNDNPPDVKELVRAAAASGAAYLLPTGFGGFADPAAAPFLRALEAKHPELLQYYRDLLSGDRAEFDEWRRQTWSLVKELCDESRLPVWLPVEGSPSFDTLPADFWSDGE